MWLLGRISGWTSAWCALCRTLHRCAHRFQHIDSLPPLPQTQGNKSTIFSHIIQRTRLLSWDIQAHTAAILYLHVKKCMFIQQGRAWPWPWHVITASTLPGIQGRQQINLLVLWRKIQSNIYIIYCTSWLLFVKDSLKKKRKTRGEHARTVSGFVYFQALLKFLHRAYKWEQTSTENEI